MSNNEQEISIVNDLVDSGVVEKFTDLVCDRIFAKLDERTKPKYEPGALYKADDAGELHQAQLPSVLEMLQSSDVGEMFQLTEGGLAPCKFGRFGLDHVRDDIRIYHFHQTIMYEIFLFAGMAMWIPRTGNKQIDTNHKFCDIAPVIPIMLNEVYLREYYGEQLLKIARWEWENLQGASPLVREVETSGTG